MKKVYTARSPAEAHLIVESLSQEGIEASVQDEAPGVAPGAWPSVWIEDDDQAERAAELIDEFTRAGESSASQAKPSSAGYFFGGLVLGSLVGIVISVAAIPYFQGPSPPYAESWDSNRDGVVDGWAEFSNGSVVRSSEDRNFDGRPDAWMSYDPPGVLAAVTYDEDFDTQADYWEYFQDGVLTSFRADNDRNGVVDEWGLTHDGQVVERNWSFANDAVADKRAFYRQGRKIREEYDRDRDGVFEETVTFDEFERVLPQQD